MAKKKVDLKLITKIIVLVLCVLTAVSFFLPVIASKEDTQMRYSNCQVCFLSQERAVEKAEEYAKKSTEASLDGDDKKAEKLMYKAISYELVFSVKDEDFDARTATVAGAWLHYAAMVASVVAIVFIVLSLFGKDFAKIPTIALIAGVAFMIASLICGLSFLATKLGSGTIGDDFALRFGGVILGLITSVIACAASFIPCLAKKKKSN